MCNVRHAEEALDQRSSLVARKQYIKLRYRSFDLFDTFLISELSNDIVVSPVVDGCESDSARSDGTKDDVRIENFHMGRTGTRIRSLEAVVD